MKLHQHSFDANKSVLTPSLQMIVQLYSNIKVVCSDSKGIQEMIMFERGIFTNVKKQVYPDI